MKTITKFILCMGLMVCPLMVQAVDYPYLVFTNTSGVTTVMSVSSLTMTVSGSSLQVTNADGSETFALTELRNMQFSTNGDTITALEDVIVAEQPVEVFSVVGEQIGSFDSLNDAVRNLQMGVYVIKQGKNSLKIIVK